jgi:DNA-binding MarR family transcriptional regulator
MTQNTVKIQEKFYSLQHEEWLRACRELKPAQKDLLYYIRTLDPYNQGIEINCANIARSLSTPKRVVHRQTVSRALKELVAKGYLSDTYLIISTPADDTERRIRDTDGGSGCRHRLKLELGGEIEVITAVGRIDLLTATEVIEIKNINEWKEGLGKLLAYSAFKPEHSKRIHLFGRCDLAKLALAQATCSEFKIAVTFETVEGGNA